MTVQTKKKKRLQIVIKETTKAEFSCWSRWEMSVPRQQLPHPNPNPRPVYGFDEIASEIYFCPNISGSSFN